MQGISRFGSAALLLALAVAAARPSAAQTYDNGAQVYNVKASYGGQPGAAGNDSGDDGPPIQRAINAAVAAQGGIVFFPAGTYRLGSALSVPSGIILDGSGWNRNAAARVGSWLHVVSTAFVPVTITGDGGGLRNLAFLHDQPTPGPGWTPNLGYPYTIEISGNSSEVHLRDILLLNPTRGIRQFSNGGGTAGRIYLDRIFGQPLYRGLEIEKVADIMYVNNLHFGPIWSVDQNVFNYTRQNGIGIISYYNDHPNFENVFLFYYLQGFLFGSNTYGVTTRFRISNFECDLCWEGIRVWGNGVTGKVSNMDVHNGGFAASVGVHVLDVSNVLLLLDNVQIYDSGAASLYVHRESGTGGTNEILVDNFVADGWDWNNQGWAAVAVGANGSITLGRNRKFTTRHGVTQTCGTVVIDN